MDTLERRRHPGGSLAGHRRWDDVDAAMLALIRLVLDDSWSAKRAASELALKVRNQTVLRRVRARVRNALAENPTPVARRAALTLDVLFGGAEGISVIAGGSR